MIDKELLKASVEKAIEGTDLFIVDIKVSPQNEIVVELDSPGSIDIDTCAAVTRAIEKEFDRDVEDYELEVGSAGLTSPFKVKEQYEKNLGNDIEVLTRDGARDTCFQRREDGEISHLVQINQDYKNNKIKPQLSDYG